MILGLTLLYVGAVLFLNSLWLMNKISGREVAVINLFVGALSLCIALFLILAEPSGPLSIKAGAFTLLFAFTYLWVAANQFLNVDGKGLGWFCLFVSLTAGTIAIQSLADIGGDFGLWNTFNWVAWTVLWFSFFLLLGLSRNIQKPVAWLTLLCAVFTGWIPGLLLLEQVVQA
ncbi:Urease accessory protein UreI [Alloalcanivorax dieselolei B5]|uniref:Urease accessory protein UreI n=1 Tax=Alcanivorax dieselolei (strain DSM 16502 / CGMCC 1.3690 / MCCC 1A00001 / B-5) TaxID=930169 RepID=K0CGL3_ALCDB|nr:AmiS/UreI family transporter [Alloalcanivorax dieselolei]AFT70837.1 Urease accessory protein UreI [Alloalcanivorax dieselolei B5]GGJ98133.1 putative transporter protein AmiS [Alloalcanivorax dieselolei]